MSKKILTKTFHKIYLDGICDDIDEFINLLTEIKNKGQEQQYSQIRIYYSSDDEYIHICGNRHETDEEYKKRLQKKTKERQDTIKEKLQYKQYIDKEAKKLGLL